MKTFYSNGKLLISGEYLVLDGALSLAVPTKYGQTLELKENQSNCIEWHSYNVNKECWFSATFNINTLTLLTFNDKKIAATLLEILQTAKKLNPNFLKESKGLSVKTTLNFPNEWGLGTSSTLINNIAQWAEINAFELLEKSFGGSGYDIACAQYDTPIFFKRNGVCPTIEPVNFNPKFKDQLFFVYLNQKQDSKEGIQMYRSLTIDKKDSISKINQLALTMVQADELSVFEQCVTEHETIIANLLGIQPVKTQLFSDYLGSVKSLGAWGGDFVMVTGTKEEVASYFVPKGYSIIFSFNELLLN